MHHVAIMKPSLGFIEKILAGQKTIESRWLHHKRTPWQTVHKGDIIFFKNSSQPVIAKAIVGRVMHFTDLTPQKVQLLLNEYGEALGVEDAEAFYNQHKHKRYCVLLWLRTPQTVPAFSINKKGFGAMSAWLSVKNIADITIKH